ncbi:MAG: hypothetical protein MJA83_07880 [Gammaproteobacteria bacterium]|nr:hypothetical protein [Gammaproteobacteria bacterium]
MSLVLKIGIVDLEEEVMERLRDLLPCLGGVPFGMRKGIIEEYVKRMEPKCGQLLCSFLEFFQPPIEVK